MRTLADRLQAVRGAPVAPTRPLDDRGERLARWFGARLTHAERGAVVVERALRLPAEAAAALKGRPSSCYFDTETTGLSTGAGTVIFLAGVGIVSGDTFVARQYLLPDYPHEPALLRCVAGELQRLPRLVTYNGRGFDMPLLSARLTMNGLFTEMATLPADHDDLLPAARRLWRRPLGGARLAMVEAGVLGVRRTSDCPGAEVPGRYFSYLRTGAPDALVAVLDHNLQDIASLALLDAELARLRAGGWRRAGLLDLRGMAIDLLRHGASRDALELLEDAALTCTEPGEAVVLRRLASRLLVGTGDVERAEQLWRSLTSRASLDAAAAWLEIARLRERYGDDLPGALDATRSASRVLDIAFALGRGGGILALGKLRLQVDARERRLRRWVAAAERRAARRAA